MAIDFDGSTDVLVHASDTLLHGVTACTFGGWIRRDSTQPDSGFGTLMGKIRAGGSGQPSWMVFIKDSTAEFGVGCRVRLNTTTDDSSANAWDSASDFTASTWKHFCCVWASGATPIIYNDGVADSLDDSGGTLTGTMAGETNSVLVGSADATPSALRYAGDAAELFWDSRAYTAAEVAALAKGYSPMFFHPVSYWPLFNGAATIIDRYSRVDLSVTGSPPQASHPRIIYPSRRKVFPFTAAAGGLSIPIAAYHYNHHLGSMSA